MWTENNWQKLLKINGGFHEHSVLVNNFYVTILFCLTILLERSQNSSVLMFSFKVSIEGTVLIFLKNVYSRFWYERPPASVDDVQRIHTALRLVIVSTCYRRLDMKYCGIDKRMLHNQVTVECVWDVYALVFLSFLGICPLLCTLRNTHCCWQSGDWKGRSTLAQNYITIHLNYTVPSMC